MNDNTLKTAPIKEGAKTITVTTVWGETFEAPAKGPVLASDYQPSTEVLEEIAMMNLHLISDEFEVVVDGLSGSELIERANETQAKYNIARKKNEAYYKTLPRHYDYNRNGTLKKRGKKNAS